MTDFDIEKFPISESGQRMLGYISADFYEKSYVGKWLLQVMGFEWDMAYELLEELPLQMFPETATWGLRYHEVKWGLPVRENLSYEERRKLIYLKRDYHAPMTPYRMEKYLKDATGFEVCIADINDPGEYGFDISHPNEFKAYFIGEGTLDSKLVHGILRKLKQSHTKYLVNDRVELIFDNQKLESFLIENICIKAKMFFWQKRKYELTASVANRFWINDVAESAEISFSSKWKQYIHECTDIRTLSHFSSSFWRNLSMRRQKAKVTLRVQMDSSKREDMDNIVIETKTPDYWLLNGDISLNGSRKLDSIYRKEIIE
ncbi:MAG: YmfQ family protein [Ruminococcus flavefaciens]|nr:YmfQ family protein [Ruminococcus flavefaciens]